MHAIFWLAWLVAAPFWEEKPPEKWSEEQLVGLLNNSPWAQSASDTARNSRLQGPPVVIYFSSATVIRQAEEELLRRRFKQDADLFAQVTEAREEYNAYLKDQAGKVIVVAVPLEPLALNDAGETERMKDESLLRIGKKKLKSTGYFPPTPSDPVLRLIFPRELPESAKDITVEMYLPTVTGPYRSAEFRVKELVYRGQPDL